MKKIVHGPLSFLATCIPLAFAACQEYASYQGVVASEPGGEEPAAGCDGGDCGTDGDFGADSCCGSDGNGGADGDGDSGGDATTCQPPEPLSVSLDLCPEPCPWPGDFDLSGLARVLFLRRASASDPSTRLILALAGSRIPVDARILLPEGVDLPVQVGDTVDAAIAMKKLLWKEQFLTLRFVGGNELYTQVDHSDTWDDPPTLCPPAPDPQGCGLVVFPVLNIEELGVFSQGKTGSYTLNERTYRYWVGRMFQYLTMECDDVPGGWLQLAYLTHTLRSACRCQEDIDCAADELCESYAGKCVPNLCLTMRCAPEYVCDPFRGECVPRPAMSCSNERSCGPDEICHPFTHACIVDSCRFIDCAPCSPLLGGCYGCLHDCDCGLGICDRQARTCSDGCQRAKLGTDLSPENPRRFELYYACLEDAIDDPGAVLRLVEPAAQCGLSPVPNTCPRPDQVVCQIPLERFPNQARIVPECWARLCALSRNPLVQNLIGGYYLP